MANRNGAKNKIGKEQECAVIAQLSIGATLNDCADYIGVTRKSLFNKRRNNPAFAAKVMQATASGKIHHINKIGSAKEWQASAWLLERKFPTEFGRKDNVRTDGRLKVVVEYVDNSKTEAPASPRFTETSN